MKHRLFLFLACMICMALFIPTVAADSYMGGDIVIGGSGPYSLKVTEVPTAARTAVSSMPPAVPPTAGSLSVTTNPAGAMIFIDGVQRGVSPMVVPGLAPGSHTLLLKMNGYNDLTVTIPITSGQTATYTADLPLPASPSLPALPSTKKTPGFAIITEIAAAGVVFLVHKRTR